MISIPLSYLKWYWLVLAVYYCSTIQAQAISLRINPVFGTENLVLTDRFYLLNQTDSVRIDKLKFYISNIRFLNHEREVYSFHGNYFLINPADSASLEINLPAPKFQPYNKISFDIGVDSTISVNGVQSGPLDPINGMYWAWNTGYIFVKLEGRSPLCQTRKHLFNYHLGGFKRPYNAIRNCSFELKNGHSQVINLQLDVKKFLEAADLKTLPGVMEPSFNSNRLASVFASCFRCLN